MKDGKNKAVRGVLPRGAIHHGVNHRVDWVDDERNDTETQTCNCPLSEIWQGKS